MDALLAKYLLGEASQDEILMVTDWLAEQPENQRYFNQLAQVWTGSGQLSTHLTANEEKAWQRFRQRVQQAEKKQTSSIKPAGLILRTAAVLALVLTAGWTWLTFIKENPVQQVAVSATRLPLSDTLPDGSVVTMNKNATISYPSVFKGATRPVQLKGEAFFKVSPNKAKPFVITAGDIQVTVLGTSFNIRQSGTFTEVIVETGLVKVKKMQHEILLQAGEKISLYAHDSLFRKEKVTDQLYNYYRTNSFVCKETPLWKLVDVMNEAFHSNISIERDKLRNLTIDATFREEGPDKLLELISQTFSSYHIRIVKKDNRIILQ
ncbi:MAG: FecR domain-containing protein [Ferruginibacter sp.]